MSEPRTLSRRDLFSGIFRRARNIVDPEPPSPAISSIPNHSQVAIVQGRFCLAYQNSFCSTCVERCPVEGAITLHENLPRVNAELCNGCAICHQLCPAPRNAILMMPKKTPKPAVPTEGSPWKSYELNR